MQAINVTNSGYTKIFRKHLRELSFTAELVKKTSFLIGITAKNFRILQSIVENSKQIILI